MMSSMHVTKGPIDGAALQSLKAGLRGKLIVPGDEDYEPARLVHNAMIDKRPAVIVRCAGVADVLRALEFAREHGLLVAVRGGGHSVSGKSTCDGGIVIDLSPMKGLRVDPLRRTAQTQAGLLLGEFDHETQAFGLATPTGVDPTTGIAGLTLGGGIGWINGLYGLACDNLISADVVTADGQLLTVSDHENSELFWGIRGGGGNFGIVTSLEYQLHPVSTVVGGTVTYAISRAQSVLRHYREFALTCPDELSALVGIGKTPDWDLAVYIDFCYAGPQDAAEHAIKPLQTLDKPLATVVEPQAYLRWQAGTDKSVFTTRYLRSWKGNLIRRLSEDAIAMLEECARSIPAAFVTAGGMELQQMHGAAGRVRPSATAFAHRHDQHDFIAWAKWRDPSHSEMIVKWVRESWQQMQPFVEQAVYSNDLGEEGEERIRATYGGNFDRLLALKNKYDPANLFRLNANIKPTLTVPPGPHRIGESGGRVKGARPLRVSPAGSLKEIEE